MLGERSPSGCEMVSVNPANSLGPFLGNNGRVAALNKCNLQYHFASHKVAHAKPLTVCFIPRFRQEENENPESERRDRSQENRDHAKGLVAPCRRSNNSWPTIPSEIAHTAGAKMLEAPPSRTCANTTDPMAGQSAMNSAADTKATIPAAIKARLDRNRSTSAPAGVCATIPAIPPTVRGDAHVLFVPTSARQINDEEWADAGLNIGEEKIQPVQAVQGLGGRGRRFFSGWHGFRTHSDFSQKSRFKTK